MDPLSTSVEDGLAHSYVRFLSCQATWSVHPSNAVSTISPQMTTSVSLSPLTDLTCLLCEIGLPDLIEQEGNELSSSRYRNQNKEELAGSDKSATQTILPLSMGYQKGMPTNWDERQKPPSCPPPHASCFPLPAGIQTQMISESGRSVEQPLMDLSSSFNSLDPFIKPTMLVDISPSSGNEFKKDLIRELFYLTALSIINLSFLGNGQIQMCPVHK